MGYVDYVHNGGHEGVIDKSCKRGLETDILVRESRREFLFIGKGGWLELGVVGLVQRTSCLSDPLGSE